MNATKNKDFGILTSDMTASAKLASAEHSAARRSWVLREVFFGFSEEARTRGFAPLALAKFALIVGGILSHRKEQSILGCT